jgi:hypothetical protein
MWIRGKHLKYIPREHYGNETKIILFKLLK